MPGASVTVDGTTLGSTTDLDGNYKINGVKAGTVTITAQFVGYNAIKKTVTVGGSGNVTADFQMLSSAQSLNEVVVIGYGSERKKRFIRIYCNRKFKRFSERYCNYTGAIDCRQSSGRIHHI